MRSTHLLPATLALFLTPVTFGQFGPNQEVASVPDMVGCIHATDLDGDGDPDVLASRDKSDGFPQDELVWYENLGGGNFGPKNILEALGNAPRCIYAADLDGDGDQDPLAALAGDDMVAWYENLGGGVFGPRQVLTTQANGAWDVYAADVDGDNDLDVLSASIDDDEISWYENQGSGVFGSQQVISNAQNGVNTVRAGDIDGDGDADVFASSGFDNRIAWYENLGNGSWGGAQILSTYVASPAVDVLLADIDGDGDLDPVGAAYSHTETLARITWYENLGGGTFGPEQVLSNELLQTSSIHAEDLDGDGDVDLLSSSTYGQDVVAWHENLGGGVFAPQQVIAFTSNNARDIVTADMDGDGWLDVVAAITHPHHIDWYRNQFATMIRYCQPAVDNHSGRPGVLTVIGSSRVSDGLLTLRADSLPQDEFGYFLASQTQGFFAGPGGAVGNLCLGGVIGRFTGPGQVLDSGFYANFELELDLTKFPTPSGFVAVLPGETWNFQCWFRDRTVANVPVSNFTDAVSVVFQ